MNQPIVTDRIKAILDFWFEGVDDATVIDRKNRPFQKWFVQDKKFDLEIRHDFEWDLLKASEGVYKDWEYTAEGRLALIILYDQFTRNMYRGTDQMYAYDALALELTLRTINDGKERDLSLIQKTFLYMPLMHFEDIKIQELSMVKFSGLVEESKASHPANTPYYEYSLKYAQEHYDTVEQHGRFPHRDAILKRSVD